LTGTKEYEHYCCICGGGVAEEDSGNNRAVERKGKTYCRNCFRREFPNECEFHPGEKLSAVCSLCKRMYCENCVIEIQGQLVCPECKEWALKCIEDGGPLEPPVELTDARSVLDSEWGLHDSVVEMPDWAFLGLGRSKLQYVAVDKDRISGLPFARPSKWKEILWDEVERVVIKLRRRRPARRYVLVKAPGRKLKIYGYFKHFDEIAGTISRICEEKGIPCLQK
jgi:hypothetical protein